VVTVLVELGVAEQPVPIAAANAAAKRLDELNLQNDANNAGKVRYFVSDDASGFAKRGGMFLQREIIDDVTQINIEEF